MNMATKHEVLQAHLNEWLACKGDTVRRGALAKELSTTLKIHKKSIGRAMRRLQLRSRASPVRSGRPRVYGNDVESALVQVWELMGYPCAEHMTPEVIEEHIEGCKRERMWHFNDTVTDQLRTMSEGTKKNRIALFRKRRAMTRGRSATVSSPLKGMIPIRKSHTWVDLPTGYLQTDTVVHCGDLLTGDVVYSVGCVDYRTYWSEYTAQWNKGAETTCASLELLTNRMPFAVHEVHPDTGNEFINYHVQTWATKKGYHLTRSEPYKKNDNMCIEERNDTIPRTEVGYARIDDQALVPLVSHVLEVACIYRNHFRPVRRMTSKVRVGAKWKRTYEKVALTPYARVLAQEDVPEEVKEKLRAEHNTLNPVVLRRKLATLKAELEKKLRERNTITK